MANDKIRIAVAKGREIPQLGLPKIERNGEEVSLTKAFLEGIPGASRQDYMLGRREHPYSFATAGHFKQLNVHHSACIEAKTAATVGLGFHREPEMEPNPDRAEAEAHNAEAERVATEADARDAANKPKSPAKPLGKASVPSLSPLPPPERVKSNPLTGEPVLQDSVVAQVLDPLCRISFLHTLTPVAEDYWTTGNGLMEAVRDDDGTIVALYPARAKEAYLVIEDEIGNFHWEVNSCDGVGLTRVFAAYGDRDRLLRMQGKITAPGSAAIPTITLNRKRGRPRKDGSGAQTILTELIHFPRPTSADRFYGWTDWLPAVLPIELAQCQHQHLYNFFHNRAIPDLMVALVGDTVPKEAWDDFVSRLKEHQGLRNSNKTFAFNLPNPDVKLQVVKLAMEGQAEGVFNELSDVLASEVVSAHGVPPLLAGIQIPGKLGASNELANALIAFQALRIGPAQELFSTVLMNTLGRDFPEIKPGDWKLRTILEKLDVQKMDTMSRMRQSAPAAAAQGRDLSAGVKS